jgi:hypothetical protein
MWTGLGNSGSQRAESGGGSAGGEGVRALAGTEGYTQPPGCGWGRWGWESRRLDRRVAENPHPSVCVAPEEYRKGGCGAARGDRGLGIAGRTPGRVLGRGVGGGLWRWTCRGPRLWGSRWHLCDLERAATSCGSGISLAPKATGGRLVCHETDVSTQKPAATAPARIPRSHAYALGTSDRPAASVAGPQEGDGLNTKRAPDGLAFLVT